MTDEARFIYLFRRYAEKQCTASEKEALMHDIDSGHYDDVLQRLVAEQWGRPVPPFSEDGGDGQPNPSETFERITRRLRRNQTVRWRRLAAAACLLGVLGFTVYFWLLRPAQQPVVTAHNALQEDVRPGNNKATLLLANGKKVALDSAGAGQLAIQGNNKVTQIGGGILRYNRITQGLSAKEAERGEEVGYNRLTTPRGGKFQVVLPDGSKVWLNSVSSLKYPVSFNGRFRDVEMQGQCYFEIAPNTSKPFRIKITSSGGPKGEVLVLGTRFGVMAYPDEPLVQTTLLDGAVKVMAGPDGNSGTATKGVKLAPGQQVQIDPDGRMKLIKKADVEKALAWKDGFFEFDNTTLPVIMRQLARWYDIDVDYGDLPDSKRFGGSISRNLPLSQILRMLAANGVAFQMHDHRLTVTEHP